MVMAALAALVLGLLPACSVTGAGHPRAANWPAQDDELFLTLVRGTGGTTLAGFGDAQLVRAAQRLCADLRTSGGGGVKGTRAEPATPTGLPGASATALAAVTGWGEWIYCPDLALPR